MVAFPRSQTQRLGASVLLVAIALVLMLALNPWMELSQTPFLLFFGALTVAAWYGGRAAGVLATLLSAILANYFFIASDQGVWPEPRTLLFVLQGLLISNLCGSLRLAQEHTKAALQRLQANQKSVRRFTSSNIIGVVTCDTQGAITEANDEFLRMTGFTQDEVRQGLVRWDAMTPDDLKHLDQPAMAELLSHGKNTPYEKAFISKQGTRVPVVVGAALLQDESDRIISFVLDLTRLKGAERRLAVQYAVTRVLAETETFAGAVPQILQALCESMGWQLGIIWETTPDGTALRYVENWHSNSLDVNDLTVASRQSVFEAGTGLPGRILMHRQPTWITDLAADANFPRRDAASRAGLRTVMGFPILLEDEVLGVLECFSTQTQIPDQDLLQLMAAIGHQLGQFIDRKRTEAALHDSQELFRSFMNNSPTTAYIKDETGRFIYANPRLLQVFGCSESELVGRTDADFYPAEWVERWRQNDRAVLTAGQTLRVVETAPEDDGEHHYVSLKFLIQGASGQRLVAGMSIDITDRVRAEDALREQEQRYRYIFEAVDVAIWEEDFSDVKRSLDQLRAGGVTDFRRYFEQNPEFLDQAVRQVRVLDVNQAAIRLCGAQTKPQLLSSLQRIFLPETQIAFVGELLAIAEEQPSFTIDTVIQTLQGDRRIVTATLTLPPSGAALDRVLVTLIDITERRQSEDVLREHQYRLTLAQQAGRLGVFDCNLQTLQTIWTPEIEALYGLQPGEFSGTYQDWLNRVHPDDRSRAIQAMEHAYQTGLYSEDFRVIWPDGSIHWLYARANTITDPTGRPLRIVGVNVDISHLKQVEAELRQSEERFRLAARAVAGIVYDWDVQTGAVYRSEGLHRLLGIHPEEALPTQEWWSDRVHPEDWAALQPIWATLLSGHENRYSTEYRVRHAAGHWVDVCDQGYLIRDSQGQILRVVGSTANITDRKRAEVEREALLERERAAREEAESANRIKDEFLAVLSHELRSPLNPILGWTRLLRTRKLNDQAMERALETIERNTRLQTQLIEDLLDVSRILRGKMLLTVEPVSLIPTIEAAIETVLLAAEAKSIDLQFTWVEPAPENSPSTDGYLAYRILGDATRLQQIVWNLLSNAIKFTPPGGKVTVQLSVTTDDPPFAPDLNGTAAPPPAAPWPVAHYAQITIHDTGKGISPDFLPHVFECFRQGDSTTTRQFGGLGLGLAIVRHLTELHGGLVQVESAGENQGATFTVRLPLMTERSAAAPIHSLGGTSVAWQNLRILVVDDEADSREFVAVLLSSHGASVVSAASAREALQAMDQFVPNLLISDIGMPEMDGYELIRQVRSRSPQQGGQIPAIALTAYAAEGDQQQALAAGFHRHLSKPIDPDALVSAIHSVLEVNPLGEGKSLRAI